MTSVFCRFQRKSVPLLAACLCACAANRGPAPPPPSVQVRAWPQADALFHKDPRWLGGDGAFSVDLGAERTLWLFGDSFIAPSLSSATRAKAVMVNNSLALQTGADPAAASMHFQWRLYNDRPAAFFPGEGDEWLWPADGIRLEESALLFFMRVRKDTSDALGFALNGWLALTIENIDDAPPSWRIRRARTGKAEKGLLAGAAVLVYDGYVYAYSSLEPEHKIFLQRWKRADARRGNLRSPQWWCGAKGGWGHDAAKREPLFADGQTEFSVHWDERTRSFLAVQTLGFGATEIGMRRAPHPEGPWTPTVRVYRPPESDLQGILVYAAKAHPQLTADSDEMIVTYVANRFDFLKLLTDSSVYYPRFLRWKLPAPTSPYEKPRAGASREQR
ncbi:MAG: DUF4185 domain-containing protein [Elusimicrobiota bacterium]